jgi:hypothetical protein
MANRSLLHSSAATWEVILSLKGSLAPLGRRSWFTNQGSESAATI